MATRFTTPEGETFELVQSRMTFAEARAVEKRTGYTMKQIGQSDDLRGSADVLQSFIWVSMKRKQPTLAFGDLDDMAIDDFVWESDDEDGEKPDPTSAEAEASATDD